MTSLFYVGMSILIQDLSAVDWRVFKYMHSVYEDIATLC